MDIVDAQVHLWQAEAFVSGSAGPSKEVWSQPRTRARHSP
jgi:hypothetical protein